MGIREGSWQAKAIQRELVNLKIQGPSSDISLCCCVDLWKSGDINLVTYRHDEGDIKEELNDFQKENIKMVCIYPKILEKYGVKLAVPLGVEFKEGL